jgi:hypothetical protein
MVIITVGVKTNLTVIVILTKVKEMQIIMVEVG